MTVAGDGDGLVLGLSAMCDVASFMGASPNVNSGRKIGAGFRPQCTLGTGLTSRGQRELGHVEVILWAAWKRPSSKDLEPYPGQRRADHSPGQQLATPTKCGVCDG